MNTLQEMIALKEGSFSAFYPNPYGNGLDPAPLEAGEEIMTSSGKEAHFTFVGITTDGKKVIVKDGCKTVEMAPAKFDIEIYPKGTKIVNGEAICEAGRTFTIKNNHIEPKVLLKIKLVRLIR